MAASETNLLNKKEYPRFGYYELVIFAFMLFEFLFLTFSKVTDSNTRTAYLLTYEFGFNSQALVGSIISLFTEIVTGQMIYVVSVISYLILTIQISLILGMLIRHAQQELKSSTIVFSLLFLASPLSVTYLLGMNTGRLDIYWIILTLLALVFLKRPVLRWTIPLLCVGAISVHQGYMATYMPALAIPMLYEVFKSKFSKIYAAVFSFSCLALISLFVFFQFFPAHIPFDNAVDFADYLSAKSDFTASVPMLYVGFFAPLKESLGEYVLPLSASYSLPVGISFLAFSLPLIFVFTCIWNKSFKHTENKFLKFIFLLCAASPLVFIPAAFIANDWDRYWAAVINSQFILLFYFVYSKESAVTAFVKKVGDFFNMHFLLFIVIIVFMNSLTFSVTATNIFSFIQDRDAISNLIENYFDKRVYSVIAGVIF
jgi:hypothetical protein